jgi:glycosyltransferase involved in cell wall biosynthesis
VGTKPNVGLVTQWCNKGQGVVSRSIRSIFDERGYETSVLAINRKIAKTTGDWDQPGLSIGAEEKVLPFEVLEDWARSRNIAVCFFDHNTRPKHLEAVRRLRERCGVKTIGRFLWDKLDLKTAGLARGAFDIIYSVTRCEQRRYGEHFGIESPFVPWGIHPSLLRPAAEERVGDGVRIYYPAGARPPRKYFFETFVAFHRSRNPDLRLVVTAKKAPDEEAVELARRDTRISLVIGEVERQKDFLRTMRRCDACVIPSRWEGLGLSFFEAMAFEQPIITTDFPPMNEYVVDGVTGLLVACSTSKRRPNGIPIAEADSDSLTACFERMADRELVVRLKRNVRAHAEHNFSWRRTSDAYLALVDRVLR